MRKIKITIIALCLAIISVVLFGTMELNSIEINNLEVRLKDLPPEVENINFVQISDIHFRKFGFRERLLLEKLKKIQPDYIFICGDLVDWTTRNLKGFEKFLGKMIEIPKKRIFLVFGNHEHRNRKIREIKRIVSERGVLILNNRNVFLKEGIYLIGVDDPHLGFDDLNKAIKGIDLKKPKILLAHSPEIFRKINFDNVLVLVGHTHGGQINLPFISNLILPLKYDKKYKRGLFGKNYRYLYVNKGIGWTFIPLRFYAKPEIAIIKIKND